MGLPKALLVVAATLFVASVLGHLPPSWCSSATTLNSGTTSR